MTDFSLLVFNNIKLVYEKEMVSYFCDNIVWICCM